MKSTKSKAQWVGNTLWVHLNGKIIKVQDPRVQSRKTGSGSSSSSSPNLIKSPMPGRITKVTVKVGDEVQEGQAVIMMEAMKMEYTLKAEVKGVVKAVKVQECDQVNLSQLLVELE
jgi:biotin carboxyl carrier protein